MRDTPKALTKLDLTGSDVWFCLMIQSKITNQIIQRLG